MFIPGTMPSQKKIYIGGWKQFREDCGATRKEEMEDFSWMGVQTIGDCRNLWSSEPRPATFGDASNRANYEDCRDALAKIEGAKEWLKNYVKPEGKDSFDDEIGKQIQLHAGHSGCSYYSILWCYKYLLNNWDDWVLEQKEKDAMTHYLDMRVDPYAIVDLVRDIEQFLKGEPLGDGLVACKLKGHSIALLGGQDPPSIYMSQERLLQKASAFGLEGKSFQEILDICLYIVKENRKIRAKEEEEEQWERQHHDLIGALVFKYQHPIRWFDTQYGSDLFPANPSYITERAYAELEAKYPGYKVHMNRVVAALSQFYLPSLLQEKYTTAHLKKFNVYGLPRLPSKYDGCWVEKNPTCKGCRGCIDK